MSKICIFVLQRAKDHYCQIVSKVDPFLSKFNLFPFWNMTYPEPFFDNIDKNNSIILSISDDGLYDNCDYLLLPDNCSINGFENSIPFLCRMKIIQDIVQEMSKYCGKIELFISDSGSRFCDYEEHKINIYDFVNHAKCLNSIDPPDVHFIFM